MDGSAGGPRVIGAGLPRTGTKSLQAALERLLGGRCYHMHEVFDNQDHVAVWRSALRGEPPDWQVFLGTYASAVDWPIAAFWRELSAAYPEAVFLLSRRSDAETWWSSANETILDAARHEQAPECRDWQQMFLELLEKRFTPRWNDRGDAIAAYERHNAAVRAGLAGRRLVEWQPGDGWEPICRALSLDPPDEPFPHLNPREEWASSS